MVWVEKIACETMNFIIMANTVVSVMLHGFVIISVTLAVLYTMLSF